MAQDVNLEARGLAEKLKIADRVQVMTQDNSFISIKDHKPHFQTNTKCRLINPAKPQLGKVSSQILQNINSSVRKATGLKQWRSNNDVLAWFDNIDEKSRKEFVQLRYSRLLPLNFKKTSRKSPKICQKTPLYRQKRRRLDYDL